MQTGIYFTDKAARVTRSKRGMGQSSRARTTGSNKEESRDAQCCSTLLTLENISSLQHTLLPHPANKTGRMYRRARIQFVVLHFLEIRNFLLRVSTFASLMGIFHLFLIWQTEMTHAVSSLIYLASHQSAQC